MIDLVYGNLWRLTLRKKCLSGIRAQMRSITDLKRHFIGIMSLILATILFSRTVIITVSEFNI